MKRFIISIICGIIGLILSTFGLIMGLQSIWASGWEKLGVIFIMPSVIAMLVIIFDFLITLDKIKKGLIYSCINSIIKIGIICCLLLAAISDYKFGASNLELYIIVIVGLIVITIPSVLNIIKLIKSKKKLL